MIKIKTISLAVTALFLNACGQESTPRAAYDALQNNRPEKALAIAQEQLATQPENSIFNSLAIAATLQNCVAENCFADAPLAGQTLPPALAAVAAYQQYTPAPVRLDEETTFDLSEVTTRLAPEILALTPEKPTALVMALEVLPEYARSPLVIKLSQSIQAALLNGDITAATKLLHPMTREDMFNKGVRHLAAYAFGMLQQKETFANANLVALKAHKGVGIPPELWGILPLVWQQYATLVAGHDWLATYDEKMAELADIMPAAAWQETARILGALTTQEVDSNIALTTRQLALWPNDEATWRNYIPAIEAYLTDTGDTQLLALINPLNVPASVRTTYNTMLFRLAPVYTAASRNRLEVLQQVALQDMPTPSQVRLEKLLQAGLKEAVERQDIPLVMAYTAFRPSVAENTRRTIVPAVIDEIKTSFKANQFQAVMTYSTFLQETLGIDFDLDSILLATYDDVLSADKVAAALSADSPDWLLRSEPYNLGAKFGFLQTRFAEKPNVTDDILKNLVSSARGVYGTPTAFYRLMHLFNNTTFPAAEQQQYLRAAIQTSLEADRELSSVALVGLGHKLHQQHDLSLNFIAIEALDRTENLDDELALWRISPPELHQSWQATRPGYATLMQAITRFDAGDKAAAAQIFNQINSTYYQQQATPYYAHYAKTVDRAYGWYIPLNMTQTSIGLIGVEQQPAATGMGLTDLQISFYNQVGSQQTTNPNTYTTNHAAVYNATLPATLNFDDNTLNLSPEAIEQTELPEPFERIYGTIEQLTLAKGKSGADLLQVYQAGNSTPQTFLRVATSTELPLPPQGTFTVTTSNDAILPTDTKLELTTDLSDPIQLLANNAPIAGKIFPISGKLHHPLGTQPLSIKGFYTPDTHLIDLQFSYPLTQGGIAKAVARCQLLGRILQCGSHPNHNNREQYAAISTAKLSASDWKAWQQQQTTWAEKLAVAEQTQAAPASTPSKVNTISPTKLVE